MTQHDDHEKSPAILSHLGTIDRCILPEPTMKMADGVVKEANFNDGSMVKFASTSGTCSP